MTKKSKYIKKNGILYEYTTAYSKEGCYVAISPPHHYWSFTVDVDGELKCLKTNIKNIVNGKVIWND